MDEPIVSFLYKLRIGEYWYAGSGTEGVKKRMKGHRDASITCPERKLYKHIAKNGGWMAVKMEIISTSHTLRGLELRLAENAIIDLKDPYCLNTHLASITPENRKRFDEYPSYKAKKSKYQDFKKDPVAWAADQEKRRLKYEERKKDPVWVAAENKRKAEYKKKKRAEKAAAAVAANAPPINTIVS
jgi:hypothetical protein